MFNQSTNSFTCAFLLFNVVLLTLLVGFMAIASTTTQVDNPSEEPRLYLFQEQIGFSGPVSHERDSVTSLLSIVNKGGGTLHWELSEDASWLSLGRYEGSTPPTDSVDVTAHINNLDREKVYESSIEIRATNTGQVVSIPVTIMVEGPCSTGWCLVYGWMRQGCKLLLKTTQ